MKTPAIIVTVLVICSFGLQAQESFTARQLTSKSVREGFPSFSPDGKYIIYQQTDMNDTSGQNGLWKIPLNNVSGAKQIFSGVAEHPRWSPDGQLIVFDADTGKSIKMIPAEGGEPIAFLPETIQIMNGGLPCWSPDATQIAFIEGSSISLCVFNSRTGELTSLYSKEGMLPLPGGWTSDGAYILTAIMERQTRKSTIWMISTDGKERKQITGHHENFYRYLALSPDGELLVYAALEGEYLGLFIMLAKGGKSLPLAVSEQGHNDGPSWSPDGKMIAFSNGSGDIWIVDLDTEKVCEELRALNEQ
jgi:Tol biopolymer transport system component